MYPFYWQAWVMFRIYSAVVLLGLSRTYRITRQVSWDLTISGAVPQEDSDDG